jgi:ParB family chromosome partitioning protein
MARRTPITGSALSGTSDGQKTLPVSSLVHNPRNPRDDYNDVGELAMAIKVAGMTSPLSVARYEVFLTHFPQYEHEIAGYDWVVLHGNRRLAAARLLDLTEVPVTIADHLGRDGLFDEAVLMDNIHHQRLPLLREAVALKELVDRHKTQAAVAERIGKTPAYVGQRIGLLRLVDELRIELKEGRLSFEDARTLSALPVDEQLPQWHRLLELRDATGDVDLARRQLAEEKQGADSPAAPGRGRPRTRTVKIGAPDQMATRLREYLSPEDLAALVKLLLEPPETQDAS